MKHSRVFLTLILILLLINVLFFVSWYLLDVQGKVKNFIEHEVGKALKGQMQIGNLSIGERQIFAQNIQFASTDGTFKFTVDNAHCRYNLLKFIFSGFKIRNILDKVEVDGAEVSYSYPPLVKKPKKKLVIPDLCLYFNQATVNNARFLLALDYPLKIGTDSTLSIREQFDHISLNMVNTDVSNFKLSAQSAKDGTIRANGVLDKGSLSSLQTELRNYHPQYINHPQFTNLDTEIDLTLKASQKNKDAKLEFETKTFLHQTDVLLASRYPLYIPSLHILGNQDRLVVELSPSTVGTSAIGGRVVLTGITDKIGLEPSELKLKLDLAMLTAELQGIVDASLSAEGYFSEPQLTLNAASEKVSYANQDFQNLHLQAFYLDQIASFTLNNLIWQNQNINLYGDYSLENRQLTGFLNTTPINHHPQEMKITADVDFELNFATSVPEVKAQINKLSYAQNEIKLDAINGYANFLPLISESQKNYYIDVALISSQGFNLSLIGDIQDKNFLLDAKCKDLDISRLYANKAITDIAPEITGDIQAFLTGNKLVLASKLELELKSNVDLQSNIDLIASYDLKNNEGTIILDAPSELDNNTVNLELNANLKNTVIDIQRLKINDQIYARGQVDVKNVKNPYLQLEVQNVNYQDIKNYFPALNLPEFQNLNLSLEYDSDKEKPLNANLKFNDLIIPGLQPVSSNLNFQGPLQQVQLNGTINNPSKALASLSGSLNIVDNLDIRLQAIIPDLDMRDLMYSPPVEGNVYGNVGLFIIDTLSPDREIILDVNVKSNQLAVPDIAQLDDIQIMLSQTKNVLIVDTLYVQCNELGTVSGSGAIDYNLLTNTYFEGNHTLQLKVDGLLFEWLDKNVPLVKNARGKAHLDCSLQTFEDQLMVKKGNFSINDGSILLQDQAEPIRNINIRAKIQDNLILLENFTCYIGEGKLTVKNSFDSDESIHLNVGFLDLGTLALKIDEPGALIYIPEITTPLSLSKVIIRGQNTEYATIYGPFEDMTISGEILVYNANIVFPPNTNNLLNLIYNIRSSIIKDEEKTKEPVPLPFTLDLMIRLGENNKYATYPTNFYLQPGSFLHLIYDGHKWKVAEASISSEQGTLDFFGTIFQTETIALEILESQNKIDIKGRFNYRSPDGTIVTLDVGMDPDVSKPLLQRLIFALSSDNENDITIASIIQRETMLRGKTSQNTPEEQNILRQEAVSMISENLYYSFISPVIYPLENNLRRWLKLDNFSIKIGFIQNLFNEYTTSPYPLAEYTDMNQFMNDIVQFSSSILLNNLSISMSKYLGLRMFLDYQFTLQEATDLQSTKFLIYHDTSLRWILPRQYRITYTFKYEPITPKMTHEIMAHKSLRFWSI